MNITIITGYSLWFILLCLILGAGISTLLYFKNKKFSFDSRITKVLFLLRFVTISLIAFLLLSPLVKTSSRIVEKPVVIIAQDNSQSILFNKDSAYYKFQYKEKLNDFISKLKKKYDIKIYSFGDQVQDSISYKFEDKNTDFSQFLSQIKTKYIYRNVGAMVIASDGLYNKGRNPLYASDFANFPIYTIALGDTSVYKDVYISKVNYNRVAYSGNKFPVEIVIKADKCHGLKSILNITSNGKQIASQNISFTGNSFTQTIPIQIDAEKEGVIKIKIQIIPIDGENTVLNNYREIFVKVIDSRQKILILSNSPHPDIAALKNAFENNSNFEVESMLVDDFTQSLSSYNLLVLHQLPGIGKNTSRITAAIEKSGIPVLYILGPQSDINAFNTLKTGLNLIVTNKTSQNEALPVINNEFTLFTLSEEFKRFLDNLPPLMAPFATFKTSPATEILLYQKIGSVSTKQPLFLFSQQGTSKTGIIVGEGLWKWKLADYKQNSNHDNFNELTNKIAQYLSAKQDSGLFRVNVENSFFENENVSFDAELYNESFEQINDPEVSLSIYNDKKIAYPFVFNRTGKAYHLDAGIFPPGTYTYEAKTKLGNKSHRKTGSFSIVALNLERITSTADHKLLNTLALKHGGKMFYPAQLDSLYNSLEAREDIKSVSRIEKRYENLVNLFWILLIVLSLLSVEWFLRKWSGNY